ncbi:hypothetical protein PAEPH01_2130 [Pancytospora epiphaga]|nr:hypothetical protein PAEPH01_2130 [Pancytospora epiphaga]
MIVLIVDDPAQCALGNPKGALGWEKEGCVSISQVTLDIFPRFTWEDRQKKSGTAAAFRTGGKRLFFREFFNAMDVDEVIHVLDYANREYGRLVPIVARCVYWLWHVAEHFAICEKCFSEFLDYEVLANSPLSKMLDFLASEAALFAQFTFKDYSIVPINKPTSDKDYHPVQYVADLEAPKVALLRKFTDKFVWQEKAYNLLPTEVGQRMQYYIDKANRQLAARVVIEEVDEDEPAENQPRKKRGKKPIQDDGEDERQPPAKMTRRAARLRDAQAADERAARDDSPSTDTASAASEGGETEEDGSTISLQVGHRNRGEY